MLHLSALPRDILLMPPRRSQKLLVILQPRDKPLPIILLAGMNHHLRRPLFLRRCLVFSETCENLSDPLRGMHTLSAPGCGSGTVRWSVGCGAAGVVEVTVLLASL